ncbi:MAG: hypothetical protein MI784_09315 [Cytophagales bacterium]|nr:hypothetical protein [Cytophagales bacterium]
MKLSELKNEILADGVVDAKEVAQLKEILYADGVIDREEADMLFEINDAVSGKENCPEWGVFFVEAISDFVLADEVTPNVVDEEEGKYLVSQIEGDGAIDEAEKGLLRMISEKAVRIDYEPLKKLIDAQVVNA